MFQFGRFPSYTYWFSARSSCFTWWGFPIRIPADQGLFAAPRSFSQLIASFFGFRCQGIHLMLFLAWTSWASQIFFYVQSVFVTLLSHCLDLSIFHSLRCSICYPMCFHMFVILLDLLFLHLCFIQFSKYSFDSFYCLVGSSGLEPPTLRLSGARSSLLSYEPVCCSCLVLPLVEMKRFELLTPCLQGRCSTNWAKPPHGYVRTVSRRQLI